MLHPLKTHPGVQPYQKKRDNPKRDSDPDTIRVLFFDHLLCTGASLNLRSELAQVVFHRPERRIADIMLDPAGVVRGGFLIDA